MNDNPMCEVGRGQYDWFDGQPAKCNRRSTVTRNGHHWCSKHDPARLRAVAAYRQQPGPVIQSIPTDALLRELKRRGAR